MNWLADQARRAMSAQGANPVAVKEAARRALPEATETVNDAWRDLMADPKNEDLRARHLQAAIHHSALLDLVGEGA